MRKSQAVRELRELDKIARYAETLHAQDEVYPISDEELLDIRKQVDDFEEQMKLRRTRSKTGT